MVFGYYIPKIPPIFFNRCLLTTAEKLEALLLHGNELTGRGVRNLFDVPIRRRESDVRCKRRLKYVDLSGNVGVTFRSVVRFVCATPSVQRIVLSKSTLVGDAQTPVSVSQATGGQFRIKTRPG